MTLSRMNSLIRSWLTFRYKLHSLFLFEKRLFKRLFFQEIEPVDNTLVFDLLYTEDRLEILVHIPLWHYFDVTLKLPKVNNLVFTYLSS